MSAFFRRTRSPFVFFALISLIISFVFVRLINAPGYTDAFYHFNAAARLANGDGLTEPYLWTYIGAPETLPESGVFPSHLYWMPLTSIAAGVSMRVFGITYAAAQIPLWLMFWLTTLIGWGIGRRIGGTRRHAWIAGLLTLFSGFFTRYWGATDTFAVYALAGSACLALLGLLNDPKYMRLPVIFAAGVFAGVGHLTRADGLLLGILGAAVLLFLSHRNTPISKKILMFGVLFAGYLAVMGFWFIRNLDEIGTALPVGGVQSAWFRGYDDLFSFPPDASPSVLFAEGLGAFVQSRWEAFTNNLGTFIAVEGLIAFAPLMLIGLWRRRGDRFLHPFALYAIGLHLAFTIVFPFPGYRGGLLHSAAALIPFWAALSVVGLDEVIGWWGKRRRWRVESARRVFSGALVLYAIGLSIWIGGRGQVSTGETPTLYQWLDARLPDDARVMINDPAMLYYFTGFGGVVIPNESPDVIAEIAERYQIDYVVIESYGMPAPLRTILEMPPDFLREIAREGDVILYQLVDVRQ